MTEKPTYEELERKIQALEQNELKAKRSEQALRRSEEKYRLIAENSTDTIWVMELDGRFTYHSPSVMELRGYTPEEANRIPLKETMTPESISFIEGVFEKENSKPMAERWADRTVELSMYKKDGSVIHTEVSVRAVRDVKGNVAGLQGSTRDITGRKRAEEMLQNTHQILETIFNHTHMMVAYLDPQFNFIRVNRAYAQADEREPSFFPGKNHFLLYPNEENEAIFRHVVTSGKPHSHLAKSFEYTEHPERGVTYWDWSLVPIKDCKGIVNGLILTLLNITDRIRTEKALEESEAFMQTIIDAIPMPIFYKDRNGKYLGFNKAFETFFGKKRELMIGKSVFEINPPELAEIYYTKDEELFSSGGAQRYESQWKNPYGELRDFIFNKAVFADSEGTVRGLIGVLTDITERKQAEQALRESEEKLNRSRRMEAMGLMAGGVAHDLNNILSGIVSYPELLLMDLPEDSPMRKPIQAMQESGMRAANVVADLLTLARGVATDKKTLNLNTIATEYQASPEYQKLEKIHAFVDFKAELDADLLNMSGSPTHIKKTLMNLVSNAFEAIEGSGTVTLSTANRYLDNPLKGYEDVRGGEYVVLTVSDDGSGISAKDLERIFEPFFTKKVMDRRSGTGLGLAVVWNTVQDHNGYIDVKSSDKGTVFELYFPVTREEMAAEDEEVPLEAYLGHGERVLVVDDEENQREIACVMLRKLGYNPEAVSSGEAAIEYVKKHPVEIIVLDMVMPKGINGRETYEEIIKIRPGQKAIIASGYAKTKAVDMAQELGAGKYIKKPYTLTKVGVAVKEELEK